MLWIGQFILWLRYSVRVQGREAVQQQPGPYLFLPNHPAFCDPPNVMIHIWARFRVRPMILETNFQNPVLAPIGWLTNAIKIPDLERASTEARQRAEEALAEAVKALRAGENVLLWPSGRLMRDGRERMGGARAVSDLLAAVPQTTVVLVRTRGLWGSMFSWAQAERPDDAPAHMPSLIWLMLKSIGLFLANLILFLPRRKVTITLEAFPQNLRPEATREAINPWLQTWFNADLAGEPEKPTWVPYHFLFGSRTHEFPPPPKEQQLDVSRVKPTTKRAVAEILSEKLKRPIAAEDSLATTTFLELGIDSLDGMDIALAVEQRFGFRGDTVPTTIGQLWALADGIAQQGPPKPAPEFWFTPPSDVGHIEVLGETIPAAFVARVQRNPRDVAAADDIAGALSYERLLVGARVMAEHFRKFEEPNIGLLMPASVAGDISLMALHLAGKLPVILNWTTGPNNLAHAVKLLNLKHVITSRAFIDRTHIEVPGAEFVFLEELRKTISKWKLLRLLLLQRWFPRYSARRALEHAQRDPQQPAVVLFTSGSEKAPKAVPLSHANIIADLQACVPILEIYRSDSVLGFLPLFHSFGHTVTGLFPLLGGVKVVHHPNPTDATGLARKVASYKPTLLATTPTFLSFLLERSKPGELDSLRYLVVGAEKCPDSIFEKVKQFAPNAVVMEGYGITECSPVVCVNPPRTAKHGTIGRGLPGVELSIRDLETHELLPTGNMGMLYLSGPTIFSGYIGSDAPDPFEEHEGKRWYVTGDLAAIDEEGYVTFHGRLKRFIKAGGEMISLPALEEPFSLRYPPSDEGPRVAVEGIELPEGKRIVLFTKEEMTLREANAILQEAGFRGVMRLDDVQQVESIPVLGTGKTDYKVLRKLIE